MHKMISRFLRVGLTGAALLALPHAWAQDAELLVRHSEVSSGPDGVRRSTEFSERVSRSGDNIWISRVLPAGSHSELEHAKARKQHKHLDVSTASRWITRGTDGAVLMRIVPNADKVVVNVGKTDYGNVGFDGSWAAAWHLMDPTVLSRMTAGRVVGDLTTYTLRDKDRKVKVVWNGRLQLPVLVETASGSSRRQTVVEVIGPSATRPWEKLKAFAQKDYSDYLD